MSLQKKQAANSGGADAEVQDFYERYPYPRPVESLEKYRQLWQDAQKRRADYHLLWPAKSYREDQTILIAGCGTSQAAKHALRWPKARVIGVDFSATSVRHTQVLKAKYSLDNLQVYQLPLERVNELATSFDQIVCTGVLHHLADPAAGLKALREALKPDGAMHLMVYAPYGRTGIYMLQEFCRRLNLPATDEVIRELVAALSALPPGHPLENLLRQAPDFRHEAALADALLHPQDRAYSVPELFDFIQEGGLTFGRWVKQAPYSPQCGVIANIPQAARLAQLPPTEQYAAVELFRGTMVRHSAVVYRDDNPSPQTIQFTDDAWLRYVPIRLANTICVEERLPVGATAVLINRTHTYTDIFLPINAAEKRLLDAIDGKRSLTEIMAKTEISSPKKSWGELARSFFERLWWYDQVLFDASKQNE
ncbi:MAG: class I SAM-dependent methyltransferase [Chloroflexi bacterium]|nr:class I SAM-dependent methyltransferase [Chloroflexota bacterium]MBP7042119.1 class I SAM-dependent methyltransferase [Chloroflexota bacterium]